MNKIKFNTDEFEVVSYTKNTSFNETNIISNAYCQIRTDTVADLHAIAQEEITTIQIIHDETLIYNLINIKAHITDINEYLEDDHMSIMVNLVFDLEEGNVV